MQLQCLEVPRSVEKCLKSAQRPRTQIHFPNPVITLTPLENKLSELSACRTLRDSNERAACHNYKSNDKQGAVNGHGFSSEDVRPYKVEDLGGNASLFRTAMEERRFHASERYNYASTIPEKRLHKRQREQPFSPSDSSLDKARVYQRPAASGCKMSAASSSDEKARPSCPRATPNRPHSRRNGWGGTSYAELIAMAIESSPHKRLSLAQIYEWIVQNVPYFKDKERYLSVQGWKNTVRHTLSIRRKFIRIKDPKRPYRSMWTIGREEGSRRATHTTKRDNVRSEAAAGRE